MLAFITSVPRITLAELDETQVYMYKYFSEHFEGDSNHNHMSQEVTVLIQSGRTLYLLFWCFISLIHMFPPFSLYFILPKICLKMSTFPTFVTLLSCLLPIVQINGALDLLNCLSSISAFMPFFHISIPLSSAYFLLFVGLLTLARILLLFLCFQHECFLLSFWFSISCYRISSCHFSDSFAPCQCLQQQHLESVYNPTGFNLLRQLPFPVLKALFDFWNQC